MVLPNTGVLVNRVLNRKPKQQRNQRRGTKRFTAGYSTRKSKRTGVLQYGGVSPSCVFDGASGADVLYRNSGANIHNTNPQASLDLDNKFMNYGGAVPLGSNILQGGAAKCGDEGRGGAGNGKSATFKQYLDGLENQYMIGGQPSMPESGMPGSDNMQVPSMSESGMPRSDYMQVPSMSESGMPGSDYMQVPSMPESSMPESGMPGSDYMQVPSMPESGMPESGMPKNDNMQVPSIQEGGGFTTDPSQYIAGLPVYRAYDDCCPPAIVNNQLVMGAPDQPVCGLGAIKGGARRRRASTSRKNKRSSKRSSKNNKSRRTSRHQSRRQRGGASGDFVYSSTKSTPAPMADAFNGPRGVFRYPDDMTTRAFGEVQPNYSVNAI